MASIVWSDAPDWIDAELIDSFGVYQITDSGILFIGHDSYGKECGSVSAAQTAAQVDWDNRLALLATGRSFPAPEATP